MFEFILTLIVIILVIIIIFLIMHISALREEIAQVAYLKRSQSVKYGQLTEQWIPFAKNFPYNSQNFRFIGKPIDGLCFEDDKVVFVEFKTNKSNLSKVQKDIKELIKEKKVEWFELRVD